MRRIRERKHRLPAESYVGQVAISFTTCVEGRRPAFHEPADIAPLLDILHIQFSRFECLVPIYCFMPDHLHIVSMGLTQTANGKRDMDAFKYESGQYLLGSGSPYRWQASYHDRIIRRSEEWRRKVAYVFQNPVRAGIVRDPWDYPLSGSFGYDLAELLFDASS